MTNKEKKLIDILSKKNEWVDVIATRKSEREFDLEVSGFSNSVKCSFSTWLPLSSIGSLVEWTREEVAQYTKNPEKCMKRDWFSLLESDNKNIWLIFEKFVSLD